MKLDKDYTMSKINRTVLHDEVPVIYNFSTGGTVRARNDLFELDSVGLFRYVGALPAKVLKGTSPIDNPDWIGVCNYNQPQDFSTSDGFKNLGYFNSIDELRNYDGDSPVGALVYVLNYHPELSGGGGLFTRVQTGEDNLGTVITTKSGLVFNRVNVPNPVPAEYFGVVRGYTGDIHSNLTACINLKKDVKIPPGYFYSSGTFYRHRGQRIIGTGTFERSITKSDSITSIEFTEDVDGFDTTKNIAIGGGLSNLAIIAPTNSTKVGIKDGIVDVNGGASQAIGIHNEYCYIKNFSTGYLLAGWAWEVTNFKVFSESSTEYGIHVSGAANAVHFDSCSAFLSASKSSGNRTGILVESGSCVLFSNTRNENNRVGMVFKGGQCIMNSYYSEGNRDGDIRLQGTSGSLSVNTPVFLHTNTGTNTPHIIKSFKDSGGMSCTVTSPLILNDLGNRLAYVFDLESSIKLKVTDIDFQGTITSLYTNWSGKFSPAELTFRVLPAKTWYRAEGNVGYNMVMYGVTSSSKPPENVHLVCKDGTRVSLLYDGSRVQNLYNGVPSGWNYVGTTWQPWSLG